MNRSRIIKIAVGLVVVAGVVTGAMLTVRYFQTVNNATNQTYEPPKESKDSSSREVITYSSTEHTTESSITTQEGAKNWYDNHPDDFAEPVQQEMTDSELQSSLDKPYNEINWGSVNLSKQQFDEWLKTIFPDYLDNTYVTNLKASTNQIVVSVMGDQAETDEVKSKLEPVLTEAISHSKYKDTDLSPLFYSGME